MRDAWGRLEADEVIEQIEIAARYDGYIGKQEEEVARSRRASTVAVPPTFDYDAVPALSYEVRQILARHRPESIAAASRLPGVTPAALSLLLVHLKRHSRRDANSDGALLEASI